MILRVSEESGLPCHYAPADEPLLRDRAWLATQWEIARRRAETSVEGALLILDEAQKVPDWSETIKRLWDEDTRHGRALRVVILGSSPLLIQRGLTETLAGRFEIVRVPHRSFEEMRAAFAWSLDEFIYYGGGIRARRR